MDSEGTVFYTDLHHVWKIDRSGNVSIAVRDVHTHELYLDKDDNLFGEHLWYEGETTDKWRHYVWRRSRNGKIEIVKPEREGFLQNYSFVRDHDGNMYWTEKDEKCQYVVKGTANSRTNFSDECFNDVRWMTSASKGTVFLVDNGNLKKIDPSGECETVASGLEERSLTQFMVNDPHIVMGLWTDNQANVYAAVYGARKVKKIAPDGKVSDVLDTAVMWSPTGGLLAENGDFWLLEASPTNRVRVERISKDGTRKIFAASE